MSRLSLRIAGILVAVLALAAPSPGVRRSPRPNPAPLDFSGVWELDPSASLNVPNQMKAAVLSVTQKENRIWIAPINRERTGSSIMAEEIVADGRPYEKAIGPAGKGIVTANWAKDGQSLWIEVKAGPEDDPKTSAIQRSIWKLSADRKIWIRESVSVSQGTPRAARLVFRRTAPPPTPSPSPAAGSVPKKPR